MELVFINKPHTLSKPRQPMHIQSLLNKCGWLSQVDKFIKAHASKTLLLFESFKNKSGQRIWTSK